MGDPFATPGQSPYGAADQQQQEFIFDRVQDTEYIKTHEAEEKKKKNTGMEIENVTKLKLFVFTLYTLSLLVIIQLRVQFDTQMDVNSARSAFYLNQIETDSGFIKRESDKPAFRDIDTVNELIRYIQEVLIDGVYVDGAGQVKVKSTNPDDPIYDQVVSTMRIKQKRAKAIGQPEKVRFPMRWNLDPSIEETTPYGKPNKTKITYNFAQGGYLINIPIPNLTRNESIRMFKNAVERDFFDEQTREVQVDFVEYDGINNYLIYFKVNFLFTPTGRITSSKAIVTFPILFYAGQNGILLLLSQAIFVTLFLYFLLQEAIKVYDHVRKAISANRSDEKHENGALAQVAAEAKNFKTKLMAILTGILNHIKNPWSFIDVISLICSLIDILLWLDEIQANTPESYLKTLDSQSLSPATVKKETLEYFNQAIEDATKIYVLFRHIAAVNLLILIMKLLKYITRLNQKIKEEVEVIVSVTGRLIPFIVLFLTILGSYVYMANILYGDLLPQFSTSFSALQYFFTSIHGQMKLLRAMYEYRPMTTIGFHLLFIFIMIFILRNMFLVYVIHAFQDYVNAKKSQKHPRDKRAKRYNFDPHILWKIKNFLTVQLPLFYFKITRSERYDHSKAKLKEKKAKEEKELYLYPHFNFDINISNIESDEKDLNVIFNSEFVIRKLKKKKKIELVKSIWKTLALIILFIFMTVATMEHHRISEAQSLASGISSLVNEKSIIYNENNVTKTYTFGRSLKQLKDFVSFSEWLDKLFPQFARYGNISLKGNETYQGYFFPGDTFLIGSSYRLTLRKRTVVPIENKYTGISRTTASPLFSADAKNPPGEKTDDMVGKYNKYPYSQNDGYSNAGGYVFTIHPEFIETSLSILLTDNVFDAQINSAVIECLLYIVKTKNFLKFSIIFEMNEGMSVNPTLYIDYIGVSYYEQAYQYFIGILEVSILCWTVLILYRIIARLRKSSYHYNYWYSLYVSNFNETMKEQREKKQPEFLRKLYYIFEFNTLINIAISVCVISSAVLWLFYLIKVSKDSKEMKKFIAEESTLSYGDLSIKMETNLILFLILRVTESVSLLLLSIKILYYYSFFSTFHFLTGTIRKSIRVTPHMAIISVFVFLAFGFFLQLIRGTSDPNFSNVLSILTYMLQILINLGKQDIEDLTENYSVFVTLVFYFPWVIFAFCVIYNMFLGIIISAYKAVNSHGHHEDEKLTYKEFFALTREIVVKKQFSQSQRIHFEVNEQIKSKFNLQKIFDLFGEMTALADDYRDPRLWSTACTQLISNEAECRKTMKKVSKAIMKASLIDYDFDKQEHKKFLTDAEKFSQSALRLKYWKYFRYGRTKLLEFMSTTGRDMSVNDYQIGDVRKRRLQQKVDLQIQRYILRLEEKVSINIRDVQEMRNKLEEYAVETGKRPKKQKQNPI